MPTRWITFDCFGTLVDWHSGFSAILNPFAGSRAAELMRAYHKFEELVEAERPYRLYKEVLVSSLLRAASSLGISITEAQAHELPRLWGTLSVFDDTEEMLEELRAKGCQLAVLTNCDEDLFELTHSRFRRRFDLVITAEQVREYKPSLAHFRHFSEITRANRSEWIHVANSWHHDIKPAATFGIRTVWLDRDKTGHDLSAASAHVHSAPEVSGAVERLHQISGLNE